MTPDKFISQLENYYGNKLPDTARSYTERYLSEYKPERLTTLLQLVIKSHALGFGTPAIATIEKAHKEYFIGDARNNIQGHESMKIVRTVSATAPVEDPIPEEEMATEADIRLVGDILAGKKKYNPVGSTHLLSGESRMEAE